MNDEKSSGYYLLKQARALAQQSNDHNFAAAFSELDGYMRAGGLIPEQWDPDVPRPGRPPMEDGTILDDVVHGTYAGYRRGCRCRRCREANTMRARAWRRNKSEADADE